MRNNIYTLSEPMVDYFENVYPHLEDKDIQVIFNNSEPKFNYGFYLKYPRLTDYPSPYRNYLKVPQNLAEQYGIDNQIPLLEDNEETSYWVQFKD